jgi:predicted molibdopterin-dependent oxidoreductase YjgC
MTTLTIDGQTMQVTPGTTVLAAALAHGIDIPHLCSHPELAPSGGCRLCLVEVEGRPTPQPSCCLCGEEGMVVRMAFGSGAMTNPIRDVRDADCILITGSNTAESHPVISYEVVRPAKQGAHLVIIDPQRGPLVDHATLFLQPTPGTDIFLFLAMAHIILREGWADTAFIDTRTEGFEAFAHSVEHYTPEVAALASGVPAEHIEQAARHYALGERADSSVQLARGCSTMLYAMGITQRHNGTDLVLTLANLAMLCGQIGKPSTGVNPLRGQCNVQGACDMGALRMSCWAISR